MRLVVTIPAFNEEKTIGKVIREIPKKIPGITEIEVLVIDDGSTDSTSVISQKLGATVLRNTANRGLAQAFSRGMGKAFEMGADIIVNTDADFQYNQAQIPLLVKPIVDGKADIVLGSRFRGKIEYMPAHKRLGNHLVSFLMRAITGIPVSDSQTGFRAFSREAALRINVFSDYTYTQETILEAFDKKLSIMEVPVDFRKRDGPSRLISNIFVYAKKVGLTILSSYLTYRPLKVFSFVGALMFLAGTLFGLRVLAHYISTGLVSPYLPTAVLSALLLIMGFQVIIIGLIAEIVKRSRKVQEEILYYERKSVLKK